MIEDLLKNESFLRWLPLVAGVVFVVLFLSLGNWQLDRAAEKKALLALFDDDGPYDQPMDFDMLQAFDRIEVAGHYQADRQILIENIPFEGRLGYYVITPLRPSTNDPLLLVNRGWIPRSANPDDAPAIAVSDEFREARGLVGHLPRVAIRPGEAFAGEDVWPRIGLYPTVEEVAAELGEPVIPAVLLLSPDADDGFVRQWRPNVSGPSTHYGYAFQWFAMALAVVGIAGWHLRRQRTA